MRYKTVFHGTAQPSSFFGIELKKHGDSEYVGVKSHSKQGY